MNNDLIGRQAAIDALKNRWKKTRNYEGIGDDIAEECELYLKQVPSAQPERKRGKWIVWDEIIAGIYHTVSECSECGFTTDKMYREEMRYCPTCGADMRGEQDDQNTSD